MLPIYPQFDQEVSKRLEAWAPKIGPPTCGKGCSNCCRVAVGASSAEGLALIKYIGSQPPEEQTRIASLLENHVSRIVELFNQADDQTNFLREIWKLGSCPFLADRCCTIYSSRPLACRAAHVWHDNIFCGSDIGTLKVPAELVELRDMAFWHLIKAEADVGRRPFWGQLTVVTYFLMLHLEDYLNGKDLREVIDAPWRAAGLIQFVGDGPIESVKQSIDRIIADSRKTFQAEHPMGLPRAQEALSRDDLDQDEATKRQILAPRQPGTTTPHP